MTTAQVLTIATMMASAAPLAHAQSSDPSAPAGPAVGLASAAGAQDPLRPPGFFLLTRFDGESRVGLQVGHISAETDADANVTFLRFAAHARYVHRPSGLGGYVQVPFAYAHASADDGSDSETITALGNLEVGATRATRIGDPELGLGLVLRAGITLPTAERGFEEILVGLAISSLTFPELYNALPHATTLKLSASPVLRRGPMFARADLGLDWNLEGDLVVGQGFYFNAGVGVEIGRTALTVESVNLVLTPGDDNEDEDSTMVNALAISLRAVTPTVIPFLALTAPVDDDSSDGVDFALTLGIDLRIP
jgi:hypothetical protein